MKTVISHFKELRKQKGLSQLRLAKSAGIGQPTIAELESGHTKNPSFRVVMAIAQVLECRPEELITEKPPQKIEPSEGENNAIQDS